MGSARNIPDFEICSQTPECKLRNPEKRLFTTVDGTGTLCLVGCQSLIDKDSLFFRFSSKCKWVNEQHLLPVSCEMFVFVYNQIFKKGTRLLKMFLFLYCWNPLSFRLSAVRCHDDMSCCLFSVSGWNGPVIERRLTTITYTPYFRNAITPSVSLLLLVAQ